MEKLPNIYDVTYVYDILRRVDEEKEVMTSDLKDLGGSWKTIDSRLNTLVEMGLLDVTDRPTGRRAKMYSMSQSGKRFFFILSLGKKVAEGETSFEDNWMIEIIDKAIEESRKNGEE